MSSLDSTSAFKIARTRAAKWFSLRGVASLHGLEPEDIAQEALLSLLRTGSSLDFISQKVDYILLDYQRKHLGRKRKNNVCTLYEPNTELEKTSKPPNNWVEQEVYQLILSSSLPEEAKQLAFWKLEGLSNIEIASRLGCSKTNITHKTRQYAPLYYSMAGLPCPIEYLEYILRRKSRTRNTSLKSS